MELGGLNKVEALDIVKSSAEKPGPLNQDLFGTCFLLNGGENPCILQPGLTIPIRFLQGSDRGNRAAGSLVTASPEGSSCSSGKQSAPTLGAVLHCCPQPLGVGPLQPVANQPLLV